MTAKRIKGSSPMYNGNKLGGKQENETPTECTEEIEVTFDSSILHCPICFKPLQLPIFQCINGHVACSECSTKLVGKCPVCSTSDTSRCMPFESMIGSYKVKCPYTKFGCAISLSCNEITAHKNGCVYAPCTCPIPDCTFKCQWSKLQRHICLEHATYKQQIIFGRDLWYSVVVEKEQPFILLSFDYVCVLLSRRVELGYALWMAHVISDDKMTVNYELVVQSLDGYSLKFEGMAINVRNLDEKGYPDFFLYVPQKFFSSTGCLNAKIKISWVAC